MGALTGVPLGVAQTTALPHRARWRSDQFAIFGAFGAVALTALSGLLLLVLLPAGMAPANDSQPGPARPAVAETR
jgi:hypothetical protein